MSTESDDAGPVPMPLHRLPEAELCARWQAGSRPAVSVICATFNHVHFIRSALDGFLAQETDFPFEVVVRDDASTDGTREVLLEYAAQYPRVIRAVIEPSNTFSRGVSPIAALLKLVRGEFVANCEGDDFWTDKRKLQLQFDALRGCPGSSLAFHGVASIRGSQIVRGWDLPEALPEVVPGDDLALPAGWFPMPATWMYRRSACDPDAAEFGNIINQDHLLLSQLGRAGCGLFLRANMAVYRLHDSSIYASKSERLQGLSRLNSFLWISRYHFRTGCPKTGRKFAFAAASAAAADLKSFGRPVALWSALRFLQILVLGAIDPNARLRRLVQRHIG